MRFQKIFMKSVLLSAVCLTFWCLKMDAYAAQGSVTYGSESYLWHTDAICPIGVYMGSDIPIESYEICLEYDPAVLEYLDGATEVIDNKIYIRGGGTETRYKHMLHFKPLQEGSTSIQAVSASAVSAPDISNGNAAEAMEIMQLPMAPVTVQTYVDNGVDNIITSPAGIEGFDSEIKEYSLTVPPDTENLTVEYTLKDTRAEAVLSDTSLATGENKITLSVSGTEGLNVYTLHVFREESPDIPAKTKPPETVSEQEPPKDNAAERLPVSSGNPSNPSKEHNPAKEADNKSNSAEKIDTSLLIAMIIVFILTLTYLGVLLDKRKGRSKQTEENKEDMWDDNLEIINLEKTVINVSHVTMKFRLAQNEVSSLKEYVIKTVKRQNKYHTLTALNDISFEVKQGEIIGIIGTNGSGKSTLLKIISGALRPTSGQVEIDDRKVQILTLGTGFDMELTAKENVYLNGAIIGYTKEYIDEKYEDIVAFAELKGFMDEKMKNFSSGMVSRLGFAIATMRDAPEILILDEVLSVGDMFFQKKSIRRIREMIHSGATVIIVSHSLQTIQSNCNRVVWIEKGNLMMAGDPKEVCRSYQEWQEK